ncbi:ABC transporter ATP-binding protein [Fusobacterium necrophorum]|uniref:ABC transporter ATP-binding protein n=1 Tax=Fusobacterium necrophorum TaxID=859 RepID=UPI0010126FC9|nr:ABC transporter ATP-binding protein [Fusobacterium necrophorum]RXZ27794.1 ABC transporter ATP-binding protein [Fusobacterium necrophorum]
MLKVQDLNFTYRKGGKNIFHNFSVEFQKGFNVILGPNGAGKSTLIKSIFGLLDYTGDILYGDCDIGNMAFEKKIEWMSYLPQMDLDISTLTVLEIVLLGRLPELKSKVSEEDLKIVMEVLRDLNIEELAGNVFNHLSGGQKKLVFIAQTLVRNPKIILLDEPTNSLDLQKQLELCFLLKRLVKEKGIDIIAILHDVNLAARYADYIVILKEDGRLYDVGSANKVICEKMLRDVYGVIGKVYLDEEKKPVISAIKSVRD